MPRGNHASHRAAFDAQRDARAVVVRRTTAARLTRAKDVEYGGHEELDEAAPSDSAASYFLKMLFGMRTWTPTLGLSTSCVTTTLPAMLTS